MFLILIFLLVTNSHASESIGLGGIVSRYTPAVQRFWEKPEATPYHEVKEPRKSELDITCFSTPSNDTYIAIGQIMRINASIAAVEKVLDDVSRYTEIFDDLVSSELKELAGNRFTLFSEQRIAVPFVPNERDEVLYEKSGLKGGMTKYRYQLRKSNHLKSNDGIILLRSLGPTTTQYEEYDFFDADWGIAKAFGADKIWKDSAKGIVQADIAVKLSAEKSGPETRKVKDESDDFKDRFSYENCLTARKPLQ